MKAINLNAIEDKNNDNEKLVAGNYVATVKSCEYIPVDASTGRGDYINVDFEISEGLLTGYAAGINEAFSFWPLTFSLSMKDSVAWKFKNFIKSLEDYDYDANVKKGEWDEHSIEGCDFGISIQMEHYIGRDDTEKTRLARWGNHIFGSVDKARADELKVVEDKYTEEAQTLKDAVSALTGDTMAAAEADNPFA